MANLEKVSKNGILDPKAERVMADNAVKMFNIRTPSTEKITKELSGGNQQKVILGRWMAAEPRILILDEPTKGIDVGAKAEIYQMVHSLAKTGIGVIFVSSELTEVINVSETIYVMSEGHIAGRFKREECSEEIALHAAMSHVIN